MMYAYDFITDEEIEKEKEKFAEEEKERYKNYNDNTWVPFRSRQLSEYWMPAKECWTLCQNLDPDDREDLIDLLTKREILYNCAKGHSKKMYRLAKIIKYTFTPAQRAVVYKILEKERYRE